MVDDPATSRRHSLGILGRSDEEGAYAGVAPRGIAVAAGSTHWVVRDAIGTYHTSENWWCIIDLRWRWIVLVEALFAGGGIAFHEFGRVGWQ